MEFLKRNKYEVIIILLLIASGFFYLSFYFSLGLPIQLYVGISILSSVLFLAVVFIIRRKNTELNARTIWILVIAGILFRLILLPSKPTASDDIYRYIWDGKVQANGINPYRYTPSDSALNFLHSSQLPRLVNFPDMKTIYPPITEWIFLGSYSLFGESVVGFKIPLLLTEVLSIFLLILVLRRAGLPETFSALYALCPLPIMQFMIDGHQDGLGFPFLLFFIYLWLEKKHNKSLVSLGLAAGTKLFPLMIIPFAFRDVKSISTRIMTILIPAGIVAIVYFPFIFSGSPFEMLRIYSSRWAFNGSVFRLLYFITHDNGPAHFYSSLLFGLTIIVLFFKRMNFLDALVVALFTFFIFSPTVHPWYLTWLAVLIPLAFRWYALAFVLLVQLTNFTVIQYQTTGVWEEYPIVIVIEYLLVGLLFFYHIFMQRSCTDHFKTK